MPASSSSIHVRMLVARVFLFFALALLVVSQFLPGPHDPSQPAWTYWSSTFHLLKGAFDPAGTVIINPSPFLFLALFICEIAFVLLVVAAPWMIGILHRAPPLLWILRILLVGGFGYIVWSISSYGPPEFGHSSFLLVLAIAMETFGLFFIPDFRKARNS